jgi:hypothetical protein
MESTLDTAICLSWVSHMRGRTARCNDTDVPFRAQQLEHASRSPTLAALYTRNCVRQPVLSAPPTAPESPIERTHSGTE